MTKTLIVAALFALAATSAAAQAHPPAWNSWNADQQATWSRLAPKTWPEMTAAEQAEWTALLQPPRASVVTVGQTLTTGGCSRPSSVGTIDWNRMTADQQAAVCRG